MYDAGARNRSDIVIGKVTSNFRPVPHFVWRDNIEKCTIRDHPLIHSLTPHKMFRRGFLVDTGIRFPKGKRRLEDQLFMVRSYLAAQCVSIVADYPCYFYSEEGRRQEHRIGASPTRTATTATSGRSWTSSTQTAGAGCVPRPPARRFYRGEMLGRLRTTAGC